MKLRFLLLALAACSGPRREPFSWPANIEDARARLLVHIPEGDRVLAKRGIEMIPDIIGNAGGVTVSYYEWIQNKRMEHWSETEVNGRLEQAIKSNYRIIRDIARNTPRRTATHNSSRYAIGKEIDMRTAAMVLALKRIEAHYQLEGFSQ